MANVIPIAAVALLALMLIAAIVNGARMWKDTAGKVVVVVAGVLLTGLMLFVTLVLVIVASSRAGHPF
jgi:hypothetical protein